MLYKLNIVSVDFFLKKKRRDVCNWEMFLFFWSHKMTPMCTFLMRYSQSKAVFIIETILLIDWKTECHHKPADRQHEKSIINCDNSIYWQIQRKKQYYSWCRRDEWNALTFGAVWRQKPRMVLFSLDWKIRVITMQ